MSNKQLTPTSFAILGLLSIQSFTTYELVQQMERTERWSGLGRKKLVTAGLATSQACFTGKRRSTIDQITAAGRTALRDWLDTPGRGDAHAVRSHDQGGVRRRGRCESAAFGGEGNPGRR